MADAFTASVVYLSMRSSSRVSVQGEMKHCMNTNETFVKAELLMIVSFNFHMNEWMDEIN